MRSILNENRKPRPLRAEVEAELRRLLGVTKIVWFRAGMASM
jgi:agmatine/peptidylarginine deiminase